MVKKYEQDLEDLKNLMLKAEIISKPFKTSKDGSYEASLDYNGYYFYKKLYHFVEDCPLNKFYGIEKFLEDEYNIGSKELQYLVENDYINYNENQDLYSWG